MQSQCDSGCVDLKNEELCSLSLVDTVISEQCANGLPQFDIKSCLFPAATSEILRNSTWIFFGCFKTKNIVCILVISVSRHSRPYFSELTFQDTEDFKMYMIFLFFESFWISSNVRNPYSPALACLWIPTQTLHILPKIQDYITSYHD